MMRLPKPKDWKKDLEDQIRSRGQTQTDILEIIRLFEDAVPKVEPLYGFSRTQWDYVRDGLNEFHRHYVARFGEQPPPREEAGPHEEVLLDTPELRREAVREMALLLANPGKEVADQAVLAALRVQGKTLVADNPTATISTILNGFKSHFEKVGDERGVFRRREQNTLVD